MMQSWLKTGTLRKRRSEQLDNVDLDSENQEEDVDFNQNHSAEQSREDRESSTSAAAAGKSRPAVATTAGGNEDGSRAKKRRKAPEFRVNFRVKSAISASTLDSSYFERNPGTQYAV